MHFGAVFAEMFIALRDVSMRSGGVGGLLGRLQDWDVSRESTGRRAGSRGMGRKKRERKERGNLEANLERT